MIKTTLDGKSTVSVSRSSTASPLLESLTYALIVTLDVELFAWHSFSIRPMPRLVVSVVAGAVRQHVLYNVLQLPKQRATPIPPTPPTYHFSGV
jgi:hypothetical protein